MTASAVDRVVCQRKFYQLLMPLAFAVETDEVCGNYLRPVLRIGIFNYILSLIFAPGFLLWKEFDTLTTSMALELIEYMMGGFLYSTILIIFAYKKRDIISTFICIQTNFVEWSLKRKMDPNKTYTKNIKIIRLLVVIFTAIVSLIAFSPLISAISDLGDSPLDTHSHWLMYWPKFCRIENLSIYLFIYQLQLVSTFFILISMGSCNIGLMVFLSELNDQFEKLLYGLNESFEYRMEKEFQSHFIDCIRHHQSIIKCLNYYKSYFKWIVLVENIMQQGLFAVGIFNLIKADTEIYYKVKVFGTVIFCLIFFCFHCFMGDIVLNMHKRLKEHIYNMPWYDTSHEHKKLILIMFQRTQKDLTLNSAVFSSEILSMTFITKVIKQVYTLLNVLLKT